MESFSKLLLLKNVSWRNALDANITDWLLAKRYLDNAEHDVPYESFIYGQGNEPVSSMLFGGNKVSNTGC